MSPGIGAQGLDALKAVFTYAIGISVVIGGFVIIYATRADASATDIRLLFAGFIGSTLTFAYGDQVQARTAKQQGSAVAQGMNGTSAPSG